jgi:hypothetical protein
MITVRLTLEELAPGMTVAEDVRDAEGHLLLGAGTNITDRAIGMLTDRAIERVAVSVPAPMEDAAAREARRRALVEQIDRRFRHARGKAHMEVLRDAVLAYRLRENGFEP